MRLYYKVVIVGAGPAGLSSALNLKNFGMDSVLVIERFTFPRYKCCAGYITNKTKRAYEKLGLNIADCHYSLIKDFNIVYKHKRKLNIENKFLYTNEKIDRVELDYALYRLALSKGIEISENTRITAHNISAGELTLSDGRIIAYEKLVFADGTTGYGSSYQNIKKKNIAMQMIFACDKDEAIDIHFGITRRGYGWVSSYRGIVNIGLTDVYDGKNNYRQVFADFLNKLNMRADGKLTVAFTPIGIGKQILSDNIFFAGDAVGACDPMTLSGLRYSLSSGEMCARAIAEGNNKIYLKYCKKLKTRFAFMRLMQKVFYLKLVMPVVFNVLCRFFGKFVCVIFNNFFVNKK